MKKVKFFHKKVNGFSFMEVMISIFVVTVGLISAVALIASGLKESMDSRNQLVASLLSQEGAELVRNIRDNNWVDDNSATGTFSGIDNSSGRIIDVENPTVHGGDSKLYYNNGYYIHDSGSSTRFSRKIDIAGDSDSKVVTSTTIWGDNFPSGDSSESNCNTYSKCAFVKIYLNKWGEN